MLCYLFIFGLDFIYAYVINPTVHYFYLNIYYFILNSQLCYIDFNNKKNTLYIH